MTNPQLLTTLKEQVEKSKAITAHETLRIIQKANNNGGVSDWYNQALDDVLTLISNLEKEV
jgi:hypothetical protein